MITVISGAPGSGKTAYTVDLLERFVREQIDGSARPLYVLGITDLDLPHYPMPPVDDWTEKRADPDVPGLVEDVFTFEPGALVVIDEAQKVYRPLAAAAKRPPHYTAFEKHRHSGLDFILITQYPTLIDAHVARLVGKHIHIRATWSGRELLEWAEVQNPNSPGARSVAARRRYKLPRHVYSLYKSAEVHTRQTRRLPAVVYWFGAAVVVAIVMAFLFYTRITERYWEGGAVSSNADLPSVSSPGPAIQGGGPTLSAAASPAASPASSPASPLGTRADDYVPRLVHRPETAPLYDGIRVARTMPVVAGCISSKARDRCRCYTQQGTDAFVPLEACLALVDSPSFDPWTERRPEVEGQGRDPSGGAASAAPRDA